MAKFQWNAPSEIGDIIARVKIKALAKGLALEYLLYLAKARPDFPKKDFGGDASENCTLGMTNETYEADFGNYREQQKPVIRNQKTFFADALIRGASMFLAGYRLTDARKPHASPLSADGAWRELASTTGRILRHAADPAEPFAAVAEPADDELGQGSLYLLRLFEGHHLSDEADQERAAFAEAVSRYGEAPEEMRVRLVDAIQRGLRELPGAQRPAFLAVTPPS